MPGGRPAACHPSRRAARRRSEREELSERVPAQVVLLEELLHVPGSRATRARLEQTAARHQRHDREHLGARPELEDREQVGEVVAQHVSGDRDRVLAVAGTLERAARRGRDVEDLDLGPVGVGLLECGPDLAKHLGVVGPRLVQPEDRRRFGLSRARDGQPDPILDRGVLSLAHAPDVAGVDLVLEQRVVAVVAHPDRPGALDLERLVVRAVLLGRLGHQADVRRRADLGRVEAPCCLQCSTASPYSAASRSDRGSRTWRPAGRRRRSTSDPRSGWRRASTRR